MVYDLAPSEFCIPPGFMPASIVPDNRITPMHLGWTVRLVRPPVSV